MLTARYLAELRSENRSHTRSPFTFDEQVSSCCLCVGERKGSDRGALRATKLYGRTKERLTQDEVERIRLGTCSLLPPTSMTASAIAFSPEIDIYLAVANAMLKALREN